MNIIVQDIAPGIYHINSAYSKCSINTHKVDTLIAY